MSEAIVEDDWHKVKQEFVSNLDELSNEDTEYKDIYILMKELLDASKIRPSGGPKSGETQTVS